MHLTEDILEANPNMRNYSTPSLDARQEIAHGGSETRKASSYESYQRVGTLQVKNHPPHFLHQFSVLDKPPWWPCYLKWDWIWDRHQRRENVGVFFVLDEMRKKSMKDGMSTTGDGLDWGVAFGLVSLSKLSCCIVCRLLLFLMMWPGNSTSSHIYYICICVTLFFYLPYCVFLNYLFCSCTPCVHNVSFEFDNLLGS